MDHSYWGGVLQKNFANNFGPSGKTFFYGSILVQTGSRRAPWRRSAKNEIAMRFPSNRLKRSELYAIPTDIPKTALSEGPATEKLKTKKMQRPRLRMTRPPKMTNSNPFCFKLASAGSRSGGKLAGGLAGSLAGRLAGLDANPGVSAYDTL